MGLAGFELSCLPTSWTFAGSPSRLVSRCFKISTPFFWKALGPTKAIRHDQTMCLPFFTGKTGPPCHGMARFLFLTRGAPANFFQQMAVANANQGDAGSSASIATGGGWTAGLGVGVAPGFVEDDRIVSDTCTWVHTPVGIPHTGHLVMWPVEGKMAWLGHLWITYASRTHTQYYMYSCITCICICISVYVSMYMYICISTHIVLHLLEASRIRGGCGWKFV